MYLWCRRLLWQWRGRRTPSLIHLTSRERMDSPARQHVSWRRETVAREPQPNPAGPSGFNSSLQPLTNGSSFSFSNAVEGIRTFNGDGTGTVVGTSVGITPRPTPGPPPAIPSFPASAGSAKFTYKFHYSVNGDGSWTATMDSGTYFETFVTGRALGRPPRSTRSRRSRV